VPAIDQEFAPDPRPRPLIVEAAFLAEHVSLLSSAASGSLPVSSGRPLGVVFDFDSRSEVGDELVLDGYEARKIAETG